MDTISSSSSSISSPPLSSSFSANSFLSPCVKTLPLVMHFSSELAVGPYRYALSRTWDKERPKCIFLMFNSSTADGTRNDPTLRRILDFAQDNGFGSLEVLNLFALRSKDPKLIFKCQKCIETIKITKNTKRKRDQEDIVQTVNIEDCKDAMKENDVEIKFNSKNKIKTSCRCPECDLVDPIGEINDEIITNHVIRSHIQTMSICLAWGVLSTKRERKRANEVLQLLYNLQSHYSFPINCLEYTNQGYPKHPLYIRKGVKMRPYTYGQVLKDIDRELPVENKNRKVQSTVVIAQVKDDDNDDNDDERTNIRTRLELELELESD